MSMPSNSNGNNLLTHYQCSVAQIPPSPPQEESFTDNSFICNSDYFHDHQSFTDQMTMMCKPETGEPPLVDVKERKRGLRRFQIDWLERSFQEEVKLDPERKLKLSQELGLHPRQVAIWFQNRRSRWKTKQLEQLYHSLKQEYYAISTEKQNLQEEVTKLRAKLEDLESEKQVPTHFMDGSFTEGTGECTSVLSQSSNRMIHEKPSHNQMVAGWSYLPKDNNNTSAVPPYWPCGLPADHP